MQPNLVLSDDEKAARFKNKRRQSALGEPSTSTLGGNESLGQRNERG